MPLTKINVGTTANDGTGSTLRVAFQRTNLVMDAVDAIQTKIDTVETNADVTDSANVGSSIHGATEKTTPVDADEVPLIDSAASNVLKWMSWANIKATLKTYFDTLYSTVAQANATHTGDATGATALTLATVNSNVGSYGSATAAPAVTVNAKGLVTAVSTNTITPAVGSITGLGTGVATALAVNVGSAGAPVLFDGAGGTPTSLTLTNATALPVSGITASTVTALGVGSVELGHASDTTLARSSAGNVTVEGNLLYRAGGSFVGMPIELGYACSDETTALTTGEKVVFYAPFAFNLTSVEVCVTTAPTGSALTVDVEKPAGTSLLSSVASISASAFTATGSVSGGTQAIAKGDRISIDIDQIGSTIAGAGLKVTLIGTRA